MQNKFNLAATCVLLAFVSWQTASAATTVRPYKFGFTIEEQQHRQEQRDERGIVMGEFGFITADGIYHVTVYATDEEGKFRIISMKNYPYAGPVAPKSPVPALTTTTRTPPPQSISNAACSGCLLPKPPHKTEIRPLSLPLSPAPAAVAPPPPQARPAGAAPTPPPGIFPGAVPARAEQPGRLVPEVYLSQTEKLVQFTMRQLATPPTPAPTTTPAPRVPRPTPPGFPIPGQPVLQLPFNHPASLPLITPLRITAQSPFPPLAPAVPLGLVGAGDGGLNVALPFQQSIAQSQVDAALAASQQVNTYTSTRTQTQTLPHGVSSFASSYSSSYPSRGGAANGGKQGTLKPLNTQVDPSSALDSTQLGNVQPASFDVSKLERIPPATSGPKDLQSHAFGTRPQGGAQGTAQSSLDRIPAGTISRGHVFGNPTPGAVFAQSSQDKIPAGEEDQSYGNPFVKDSATAHSSPVGIAAGAVATPVHQGVIFGNTPQDFVAAQSLLDTLAVGTVPAAFVGAVAQGNAFGSPVKGATGAASGLAGIATDIAGTPVQQSQIFGKPAQGSSTQQGSPSSTSPQGAAASQLALGGIPANEGATPAQQSTPQSSAAAQQTPANSNQANLQGSPNAGGLTRPTPERPFLINATPSPLRVPYAIPPVSQSADRLNDKVVNSLQQVVLPVTQTITKLMRGPPALEKFLHEATPVPARLHQSGSPPAVVSPFHELVGTSSHTAAVSPQSAAAASLHTAASSPHSIAGVANRPQNTQQIVANKLQNIALPVTQHIGDLLVQNTHNTPVPHSTAHNYTPSAPTLSAQPSRTPFAAVGNAAGTQQQPRPQPAGAAKTPTSANSPNLAGTGTKTGQTQFGKPQLASAGTFETGKAGKGATGAGLGTGAGSGAGAGAAGAGQRGAGAAGAGAGSSSTETGDLYHFKYLLDYNGHEETGSRNGNKQGNYFALGNDAVARTIEYIANEFGFQPHISWRKLDQSELSALPKENALKHYEFKWFNKPGE